MVMYVLHSLQDSSVLLILSCLQPCEDLNDPVCPHVPVNPNLTFE